jgi:hypothetical protein
MDLFDDSDEKQEVEELLTWWNRYVTPGHLALPANSGRMFSQVFPNFSSAQRPVVKNSALARIRERRAALKQGSNNTNRA